MHMFNPVLTVYIHTRVELLAEAKGAPGPTGGGAPKMASDWDNLDP